MAGSDRYATSAAISKANYAPNVDVAYIANGGNFPDALSGAAPAGANKGPILLATTTGIPAAIATELARLKPKKIVILGGTGAINSSVATALKKYSPNVARRSGADRYATSAAISKASYGTNVDVAYIADGGNFPDALSGAAPAGANKGPILLSTSTRIPAAIGTELSRLKPKKIVILGGTGAINSSVATALKTYSPSVTRKSGADRYATSAAISKASYAANVDVAYIANGSNFPDALSGAAPAGANKGPILLATTTGIPAAIAAELTRLKPKKIVILGGTGAINNSVASALRKYLDQGPLLRIKLSELPATSKSVVTIKGTDGRTQSVTVAGEGVVSGLSTGTYTVTASNVKVTGTNLPGTYFPSGSKTVTLSATGETSVSFSFATVMNPQTITAPTADIVNGKSLYATPGTAGTVTLRNGYHTGDIVVAPRSAAAPQGLWIKLVSARSATSTSTTWTTAFPKVDEVFARGEFSTTLQSPVVLDASTAPASGGATAESGRMGDIFNPFSKELSCGASASMNFDAKVGGDVTTEVSAKWGFSRADNYIKAAAGVEVESSTSASVSGDAECILEKTDVLRNAVKLPTLFIPVGPLGIFQVPVFNSLQFTLEGTAKSHASLATSASAKVESSVEATLSSSGLATSFNPPAETSTFEPPNLTVNGEASFYLGARVDMQIAGVAGPFVTAAVGPELKADISADPWWSLDGKFKAGIGIDPGAFENLGLSKKEKDDLITSTWNIAHAPGPLTSPSPTPTPGGTGGGDGSGTGGDSGIGDGSPGVAALRSVATYNVESDLKCSLWTHEDSHGEFYSDRACGTLVSIGDTLYGPEGMPASGIDPASYTPVSQSVTGDGTAAHPIKVETVVDAGTTGIRLTQTDTWVKASNVISTRISVQNRGTASTSLRLYRGFDCYLGDSDTGTGELNVPGQLAGCLRTTANAEVVTLRLQGLTAGATVTEGRYSNMWSQIGAQGDLNNACQCFEDIDNGVAVGWNKSIPAGQSLNLLSEISLRRPSE
ncbi:cell wall-binding repeat-containing protein [Arthrobacter sp. C9C5]|uniref:cell wall-binding repeat-containing protein n=1 Tax=Arthrobacter sp. C9C5 TaxID=2735267 RepID=UPI0015845A14|nr:cell wall-binding repeat-containing protein [Arthrobacter sp. C9C5]NUU33207.1 cell wall-binding repeat-containing protein [Arthrobacter sp. C9C5]